MRLIDANSLKRHIGNYTFNKLDYLPDWAYERMIKIVDCEKTVESEPTVHAHWIEAYDIIVRGNCSNCGWQAIAFETDVLGENYCPHCGSKMDEVTE